MMKQHKEEPRHRIMASAICLATYACFPETCLFYVSCGCDFGSTEAALCRTRPVLSVNRAMDDYISWVSSSYTQQSLVLGATLHATPEWMYCTHPPRCKPDGWI